MFHIFGDCLENCRKITQNEMGNQEATSSQNKFLAIVSKLIKLHAATLFKMQFGSGPVNHILVSEQ